MSKFPSAAEKLGMNDSFEQDICLSETNSGKEPWVIGNSSKNH